MAFCIGFYAYAIMVHTRADQLLPQLLMEQLDRAFVYALMVPSWTNQLLPQLLMEQFDTLPMLNICIRSLVQQK